MNATTPATAARKPARRKGMKPVAAKAAAQPQEPERSRDRGDGGFVPVHRGFPAMMPLREFCERLTLGAEQAPRYRKDDRAIHVPKPGFDALPSPDVDPREVSIQGLEPVRVP